jgi:hypothetical protein
MTIFPAATHIIGSLFLKTNVKSTLYQSINQINLNEIEEKKKEVAIFYIFFVPLLLLRINLLFLNCWIISWLHKYYDNTYYKL